MKKFVVPILTGVLALSALLPLSAQNSKNILSGITSKIESGNMVEIEFEFSIFDEKGEELFSESGIFEAQDSLYKMQSAVVAIYCNAYKKWIYDIVSDEITIFPYQRSLNDITENPLLIFTSVEGNFTYPTRPKEYDNGKGWIISLKPIDKNFPYESIEIAVDRSTALPVAIRCLKKDKGIYHVDILSFKLKQQYPVDYFILNIYDYPNAYVTDLSN